MNSKLKSYEFFAKSNNRGYEALGAECEISGPVIKLAKEP